MKKNQEAGLRFELRQASTTKEYAIFEIEGDRKTIAFTTMDKKKAQDRLKYLEKQEARFQSQTTHENPFAADKIEKML